MPFCLRSISQRDESTGDVVPNNVDAIASKSLFTSPPSDSLAVSSSPVVNGSLNSAAFTSNASVNSSATETQATEPVAPLPSLSEVSLPTPVKTLRDDNIDQSAQIQDQETAIPPAEAAVEAAIEESAVTSSVPPVIDAQESDLRHEVPLSIDTPINDLEQANISPKIDALEQSESTDQAPTETQKRNEQTPAPMTVESADLSMQEAPALPDLPVKIESEQEASKVDSTGVQDTEMEEAPQSAISTKIPREREDDDDEERSAKRTKTEDDSERPVVNGVAEAAQNGESTADHSPSEPAITPYLTKELIKQVKNAARTTDGRNFRESVAKLWPGVVDGYLAKVSNPTDFATIEQNLRAGSYPTLKEFKADIKLLHTNSVLFNGEIHDVTKAAKRAYDALLAKVTNIPPEPTPAAKKEKKPKAATPVAEYAPKPRRQSKGAATDAVFSVDPNTKTPVIRRDSTKAETGRPKRDIIPPKNKDLSYSVRPKSKKYAVELRWCREVLSELKKPKYTTFSYPFQAPVDPVALGIPTYFSVIKHPMDISTVDQNLTDDQYSTSKEFEKDVGLIFSNAYKFNPPGNPVHELAKQYEALWKEQLGKKSRWISDHTPNVASASPTPETEAEESEAEPEQPANVGESAVFKRLVEEQQKLIALLSDPSSNSVEKKLQQDMVDFLTTQVAAEKSKAAPAKKLKKAQTSKSAAPKKKVSAPSKPLKKQKQRYLGTLEKEVISNGIGSLPEDVAEEVLGLIQADRPDVGTEDDGTLELDIDSVAAPTLWKIYDLVQLHCPDIKVNLERQYAQRDAPRSHAKPAPKKKNKPMNKYEQDQKIKQLEGTLQSFERHTSGSQEPLQCKITSELGDTIVTNNTAAVENHANDSSGDEDSDSEEE